MALAPSNANQTAWRFRLQLKAARPVRRKRRRAMRAKWTRFFFYQAEDGIRDLTLTGVQTCALPIFLVPRKPFVPDTVHANPARTAYGEPGANARAGYPYRNSPAYPVAPIQNRYGGADYYRNRDRKSVV